MEIQSPALGFSLDTFGTAGSQSGAKDDMFAQMIARMMDTSSARRQENANAGRSAPRTAAQDDPAARAADKARDAKAAADKAAADKAAAEKADASRADARTRLTTRTEAPLPQPAADTAPRPAGTEQAASKTDAGKPAADTPAAKPATKADSGTTASKPSRKGEETSPDHAPPPAGGRADEAADKTAVPVLEGEILPEEATADDASQDGPRTVVIEAEITIVETTVEVITAAQTLAVTMTQGNASLSVAAEGQEGDAAAEGADATAAVKADGAAARPAAAPLPGHPDGKAPAMPADARPDTAGKADAPPPETPGLLNAAALPTDESAELPESIAGLFQNAGASAAAREAAAKGQGAGSNPQQQGQQQQPFFADPAAQAARNAATAPAAAASRTAFEAVAAATGLDMAQPTAAAQGIAGTDPLQTAMAPIDGMKGVAGADGVRGTPVLHPSRGLAHTPQGVPDQITVNIQRAVKDGKDHFSIRLNPEDLGRIDIRLEIAQDGRLQATIAVEKAQTLELLQRDQRSLENALNNAGLKADSDSLNFSLHGDGKPFAGENGQDGSNRRGRGRADVDPDEQAEQDAALIHTMTLGPGRYDVRV